MDKKLSVAIITYNEEKNIERTLSAVNDIADEIIVVDSFSKDRTKEICQNFEKVKFVEHKWDGFGKQKNYALSLCSFSWILFVDADEELDKEAQVSIRKIVNQTEQITSDSQVYLLKLDNYFFGKLIKYGGWGSIWRERFFYKGSGKFSDDIVHEKFVTNRKPKKISGTIKHHTYNSIFHHIQKMNSYTEDMSKKMLDSGKKSSALAIVIKPTFSFFKTYFLRLGILDGSLGFYSAVTTSFYTFLKYTKLYELQNKE